MTNKQKEQPISILEANNLQKSYKRRKVVSDVSFRIASNEIVGLLGPNGAGKTTSFYMVVGLVNADKGKILLDGKNITHVPIYKRAKLGIGYLPQEPSIFRKLTTAENIMAILELRSDLNREEREETLDALLSEFHIQHIRNNIGLSLSGGERRRVEIARAVAYEPKFILLDEPFAGIDPISIIDIKNTIQKLSQRGIGILITDHNVRETLDICERSYIISEGKVLCVGSKEEILSNDQVKDVYLGHDFAA
jgi:lipopolysaccharide export system ATP-binding protein